VIFTETPLSGAYLVDIEPLEDERGFFARTFCVNEFISRGLNPRVVQCSVSLSARVGTLRGMHYQIEPFQEAKLVRCTRGAMYDVIVDIRPESTTYGRHFAAVLASEDHRMLYIPEGFAHGFLTLTDDTEVFYQISEIYSQEHARGFRWDDPVFGIEWPRAVEVVSERDRAHPAFVLSKG
jgi:dTDP-4-dehydrorhamnose 3,5-epimerase